MKGIIEIVKVLISNEMLKFFYPGIESR